MPGFLYSLALWLALPWMFVRLWWRGRTERLYRSHIAERFGRYAPRDPRSVIWIHAVSLGETRAAQSMIAQIRERFPEYEILVTHMTATGRGAALDVPLEGVTRAWLPYDYRFAVQGFLGHFRPSVGILVETEIWPNLIDECARQRVPLLLANARMSERSAAGYLRLGSLTRSAFAALSAVGAQSETDAERLRRLGAREVVVTGNMKFDFLPGRAMASVVSLVRQCAGSRPVFVAASTREGEERLILDAFLAEPGIEALIVIVPRHPQRFAEVARLLGTMGVAYARRSDGEAMAPTVAVLLGDSLGELPSYYAASDMAFVGGSLVPRGGQNLIEACAAGIPVLFGPHTFNFSQASDDAVAAGAAVRVASPGELKQAVQRLLADPDRRRAMGMAGKAFCERHRGATARTVDLVAGLLGGKPAASGARTEDSGS